MSDYEMLMRKYEDTITGIDIDGPSWIIDRASSSAGSLNSTFSIDGPQMLNLVEAQEGAAVSAEQIYYDAIKSLAIWQELVAQSPYNDPQAPSSVQQSPYNIFSVVRSSVEGARDLTDAEILAAAIAVRSRIIENRDDQNRFNDGPTEQDPDFALEVALTEGRSITVDSDAALLLGGVFADQYFAQTAAQSGEERAVALAREYVTERGGVFAANEDTQETLHDLLADEPSEDASFANAWVAGMLAAFEGEMSVTEVANDNINLTSQGLPAPRNATGGGRGGEQ